MNSKPSIDERIWAVLAHLSSMAMGIGLPLSILGWSQNRRKSNYASFQSMQALGYQTLGYTVWILATLIVVTVSVIATISDLVQAENLKEEAMRLVTVHTGLSFVLIGIYFVMPIVAAIACALGKDFHYPLMGNRLARYLGYDIAKISEEQIWLIEKYEDRWVVSMGHFAVIIVFWGLLAPVFVLAMQGKRNLFLKFQSIQTVVYQIAVMVLYIVSGFLYVFGLVVFFVTVGFQGEVVLDSTSGLIVVIVFLVSLLIALLVVLFVPLLHILGQWAGYRVLKGDMYRYPMIGKLVEKRLSRKAQTFEETLT